MSFLRARTRSSACHIVLQIAPHVQRYIAICAKVRKQSTAWLVDTENNHPTKNFSFILVRIRIVSPFTKVDAV
jgi:hypothetical protein